MIPNCTKTQLREFIDAKIEARKEAVNKELDEAIFSLLNPFMDKAFENLPKVEELAEKASKLFSKAMSGIGNGCEVINWSYSVGMQQELNKASRINKKVREATFQRVRERLLENRSIGNNASPEFTELFNQIHGHVFPCIKRLNDDLPNLQKELNAAIGLAGSGKQAYKSLVSLGIDMSDFQPVNTNLPAVVKLSVDACIFNGGC